MADNDDGYVIIEHRTGSFGTFVWGLLLGAGAALLFAPKSGSETRDELADRFDRLREETEHRVREVQGSMNATLDDVRRQFEDGMDAARSAVDSGREAVRASSDAFRSGYEAARSGGGAADGDGSDEA